MDEKLGSGEYRNPSNPFLPVGRTRPASGDSPVIPNCRQHFIATVVLVVISAGCQPSAPPATTAPASPAATASKVGQAGHGHGAGPHEGTLADWGGGKYHVEFTVDHELQTTTVYVIGSDEKTPAPIKTADGKLLLTISEPAFQIELTAKPLAGETEGTSSRFVGKNEKLGVVQEFAGTISGDVNGTPYAGDFKEEPHTDPKSN